MDTFLKGFVIVSDFTDGLLWAGTAISIRDALCSYISRHLKDYPTERKWPFIRVFHVPDDQILDVMWIEFNARTRQELCTLDEIPSSMMEWRQVGFYSASQVQALANSITKLLT